MANFDTNLFRKKVRHRGVYGGKPQAVTGSLRVNAGAPIALADLIRAVPLGENVRPVRIILQATPVSGTPVLTNATFSVGVTPLHVGTFTRPDGTTYPAIPTSATALVTSMAIDADNMKQDIEIKRPVADSVSGYAPYTVTLTPAGAGAFSVAGGNIDLHLTVEFIGEQKVDGFVYNEYVNSKVKN